MKKRIKISIKRQLKNKKIKVSLSIPKELENLMMNQVQTSQRWFKQDGKGAEFYKCKPDMERSLNRSTPYGFVVNDFGSDIITSQREYNVAMLRVKGTGEKGGVDIFAEDIGIEAVELEGYVKNLGFIAKEIYKKYLQKVDVKAVVTFEI